MHGQVKRVPRHAGGEVGVEFFVDRADLLRQRQAEPQLPRGRTGPRVQGDETHAARPALGQSARPPGTGTPAPRPCAARPNQASTAATIPSATAANTATGANAGRSPPATASGVSRPPTRSSRETRGMSIAVNAQE